MATFTVTATQGGSPANGMALRVFVLTQAAATQNGAAVNNLFLNATSFTLSITTTQTGSRVYGASAVFPQNTVTAAAATTVVDNVADGTNNAQYVTFKATSLTGTPGATTLGFTSATASGPFAMFEVKTAGTLTEDASGPAVASTTAAQSVTTASFTPPAGALLVALVAADGGTGQETMALSDTSGLGLAWVEQSKSNITSGDYAGVWTAQLPAGGGIAQPPQPGPRSWRLRFRPPQTPVPPNPPPSSAFTQPEPLPQPGAPSWRRRFRLAQTPYPPLAPPPAAGVPSPFTPPASPLRGQPAAARGTLASIQIKPPTTGGPAAPFFPPHGLLRGAAAAIKGKLAGVRGQPGQPSPFRLPGLLRGQPAARKGTLAGARGRPGAPSPFTQPASLQHPAPAAARPGRLTGTRGRAGVPAPFTAPRTLLRGQPAARRGALAGTAAPPPVTHPNVPAPFFPPHSPLRGAAPGTARTKLTGIIAPPPAPPPVTLGLWQGATHMVAADASGNLIQGARHTGKGGPGPDLKGDYESGD